MIWRTSLALLLILLFVPVPARAQEATAPTRAEPEAATGWSAKAPVTADRQMVVTAHPLASRTAIETLRKGGSAVDAAIAAQLVLNLVEPQSSGLGGGGFIVHWDAKKQKLISYDGRETAPAAANPDRFIVNGRPLDYYTAVKSARSVGVPGLARLLELAHKRHGKLEWAELFQPAIRLAEDGFPVGERLNRLLRSARRTSLSPEAKVYFFDPQGVPWPVGHILKNPEFARLLRKIADEGADAFHAKGMAEMIVASVRGGSLSQDDMTVADVTGYTARERAPVCAPYREYRVCGMGPPSSGALTLAQILMLLEPYDLGKDVLDARAVHLVSEAQKLAYADRRRYMVDEDFVPVPRGLLDPRYVSKRRGEINPNTTMERADPGKPPGLKQGHYGSDTSRESNGTTHLSIIDAEGNVVSMTTTIESGFGSGLWVSGFLLNNELTDFAFRPTDTQDRPVANRVQGGKRSRSSMSPTIVFDKEGKVRLVIGSPGGSRIMLYVLKVLIAHLDWGLDIQEAVSLPNFGSRNGPFEIEDGPWAASIAEAMRARGHRIRVSNMTSGIHAIAVKDGKLEGGADPRREGVALGD